MSVPRVSDAGDSRAVPRDAMRFSVSRAMQFADSDGSTNVLPFRMLARSKDPVDHYYWGRIVHDFAGMRVKESITVDWAHSWDDVIGFANQFSVTDAGLEISGGLVTTEPNDKADEIYRKGKAGIPYECSIDWNGSDIELEWIGDGITTEVNGQQFAGPGYVVRQWPLRAMSICRYGVDPKTETQFSKTETDTVSVSIRTVGRSVSDRQGDDSVTKPATTPPAAGDQQFSQGGQTRPETDRSAAGTITLDTLKQFSSEFGAKGLEYLQSGLDLNAARYQFAIHERDAARAEAKQFSETITARDAEIATLKTQLKQFGVAALGQTEPLNPPPAGAADDAKVKQFSLAVGDTRAKIAAAMKLRGT